MRRAAKAGREAEAATFSCIRAAAATSRSAPQSLRLAPTEAAALQVTRAVTAAAVASLPFVTTTPRSRCTTSRARAALVAPARVRQARLEAQATYSFNRR